MEVPIKQVSHAEAYKCARRHSEHSLEDRFGLAVLTQRIIFLGRCVWIVCHRRKHYTTRDAHRVRCWQVRLTDILDCHPDHQGTCPVYESKFEEKLYDERREKLRQIAALGEKAGLSYAAATYPNSYATTHTVAEVRDQFDALSAEQLTEVADKPEVSIAGRIMAIRVQGKAGFAQLQQSGTRLQIYVRKDDVGEDAFALYKLLDLGDHIGVRGYMMRTRTGELTVHVTSLIFLAKAMLALPDKYHGLEDTELRYRQRYVDLFMNTGHSVKTVTTDEVAAGDEAVQAQPEGPGNVREVFVKRAAILRAMRTFFDSRGYLEVETPMMHTVAGGAAARPFNTHHNALDLDLKLRIAPELYLKRLVVGGMDRVYEINRNFRNEGISTQHNPEFTMLEFYQAYSNYHDLMDLTEELVTFVATEVNGTTITNFNGHEIDLSKWQKLSMREAIIKWWPPEAAPAPSASDFEDIAHFASHLHRLSDHYGARIGGIISDENEPTWSRMSAFSRMSGQGFVMLAEAANKGLDYKIHAAPMLGKHIAATFELLAEAHLIQPTIIYDFPLAVSPLSKVKPDEPEWVERFEFYIGGFEVGNAFSELNDPDDQRARFEAQLAEKARGDEEAMAAMDEDYIRALGYGLPPTAGEGIGIDRLTMILTGSKSIRDVILFPLLRPHSKVSTAQPEDTQPQ
jgi:lysyl-tRNA synthetase class 2